jgi:ribonucleoside-triphosphate reductase
MGYKQVGRGNICPTTIILPKLGIEYGICLGKRTEPDIDGFWKAFDEVLDITKESLINRYAYISNQSPKSAPFMYQNGTIADTDKCNINVEPSIKHGTLALGFIGVAEMCEALFGTNCVHDKKVYDFALSVVKHIYDYAKECSEKYNLNFPCYATPAEGLCEKAEKYLKDEYGIISNITDKKYLTNSTHVPVWEEMPLEKKFELEAPFTKYELGGCITYGELNSDLSKNPEGVETIIDRAMELDIPYLALNFPIDTCQKCGFQGKIEDACPNCHSTDIYRIARVTGYLSTDVSHFNEGKQAEVKDRVTHDYSIDFGGDAE